MLYVKMVNKTVQLNNYFVSTLSQGFSFFPPSHGRRDCEGIQYEVLIEVTVFLSATEDKNACFTVRSDLSHPNIAPFAKQMKYLPL